jgi:hypothetical protein
MCGALSPLLFIRAIGAGIGFRFLGIAGESANMAATVLARKSISNALPLDESIRGRAYELYVGRGQDSCSEQEDWLQAKREILVTIRLGEETRVACKTV